MQLELVQKKRNLREAFSCFYAHMKPRAVLRWITGLLLLFWFVTPLYMVVSMGARAHAGLWEILRVYPRFMVQEGWLGSATWVTVGLFVLLSPSLLGRIEAFFTPRSTAGSPAAGPLWCWPTGGWCSTTTRDGRSWPCPITRSSGWSARCTTLCSVWAGGR